MPASDCPCGSGHPYPSCCGRLHAGTPAADAQALMRSRYSAYVYGLAHYLLATWHISTRPEALELKGEPQTKWLGLKLIRHVPTGDDKAIVEFVARYRIGSRGHRMHEISSFLREDGRWFYVDGETEQASAQHDDAPTQSKHRTPWQR